MKGTLLVVMVALALAVTPVTPPAADDSPNAPLVDAVRRTTEPFKDVTAATAAGYAAFLGCVSGPSEGAMGIHFVNGALVGDGQIDVQRPEALMYEPKNGQLHLVGVEYIVIAQAWDAAHQAPPTLMG